MRLIKAVWELSLPLVLITLACVSSAVGVQLEQLTPATFESTRAGLWFVEYFTSWSPHCKRFLPTWEKLVDECEKDIPSVHLAQVDCTMYDELCTQNGVRAYPSLFLYKDGKRLVNYHGKRNIDDLKRFLEKRVAQVSETSIPGINTKVEVLTVYDQATFIPSPEHTEENSGNGGN